ncbi:hypothetical protein SELMODRAFT_429745 [Selaginella moellendorffii]|uniref:Uncharacterized protein n=1 Tax=Selaginella moellendorffii TaxID=88036 RepID=D8T760_SELML|nr:uncharacterized protein LOC9639568 [Selaginella moellendorffii]EFJ07503.1 hypothetical protein SELMODRAFT_429745 [Selaginella moellendorffii]|eukprot:XP_002991391.1 uncharacterized protein LOC9639568 [Selaginella moellendorffii]
MAGNDLGGRRAQPARSVSRLRSTLLLRRSVHRNQKFVAIHEERSECSSAEEESDDASVGSGGEDMPTADSVEPRGFKSTPQFQARESDSTLSSKTSADTCGDEPSTSRHKKPSSFHGIDMAKGSDDDEDEESEEEEAVIDAVLAFQRWRQHNLKRSFSHELKKVLEEARRDEASLTSMQRELMKKDVNLVRAQAETAQLRAHISAIEDAVQSSSYNEEAKKEVQKAQERALAAEEEVHRRDREINRLRQRLKCIESEKTRVDENLKANLAMLQQDKVGVLKENRIILDQLARKDQELTHKLDDIKKLQATIASMADYHNQFKTEHEAAYASLQDKLAQEGDAKATMKKEAEDLTRKCELLEKEKECLNVQVEKMLEKMNSATLHDSAQCSSESQSRTSEAIAAGILEHLRILTNHMIKLEASFGRHTRGPGLYSSLHKIDVNLELALKSFRRSSGKAGGIGGKLQQLPEIQEWPQPRDEDSSARSHCVLNQTVQTDGELSKFLEWLDKPEKYLCVRDAKTQTSGVGSSQLQLCSRSGVEEEARWLAWKWRWLSTALKAKLLSKQLRYSRTTGKVQAHGGKSCLKNGQGSILGTMERELRVVMGESIVRMFLQLWRTYRRSSKAERKALSKDLPLDKVVAVFPWWIRRVGEKRRLERSFCQWYYLASCSVKRQSYHMEEFYFHPHSCYSRPPAADEYLSVRRKVPKFKYQDNSSDGNAPQQGLVVRKKELDVERGGLDLAKPDKRQLMLTSTHYTGSTFTARALRTLQVSLQQEFQDLQQLLAKEMEASQVSTGHLDNEKSTQRRRMTFLWEVCNNLANALMDAHKQLVSLDREFSLRVCNYLELSANSNCEPKQAPQNSPRGMRGGGGGGPAKSPTSRGLRPTDPVLRFTDDYPGARAAERKGRHYAPHGCVSVSTTRKPGGSSSSRKKACIASQCAAILQSEARRYGQDTFDKGTMVQEEFVLSPRFTARKPPWTR